MTQLRIKFDNTQLGPKFKRNRVRDGERVLAAARGSALDAQKELLTRGRQDIKQAGNFGRRWTDGLTAPITEGGGRIVLSVRHAVPYFMVFQKGKVIRGKPLLWIPLSFSNAVGIRARDFKEPLFRVNRIGKAPLLLSAKDKKPKYFGKTSVRIPKKFHILEIGREVARKLKEFYRVRMSRGKR